jgi:hypothetical protein
MDDPQAPGAGERISLEDRSIALLEQQLGARKIGEVGG